MTHTRPTSLLRFCLLPLGKALSVALLLAGFNFSAALAGDVEATTVARANTAQGTAKGTAQVAPQNRAIKRANLKQEVASVETTKMADWVVDSGDNKGRSFVIIDKKEAKVFVFNANGVVRGSAPVLLGIAVGDDSFPGVGDKPLHLVKPEEKTTPAGRFLASSDKNIKGVDIVWIDYDGAVSMHALVKGTEAERRAERMASPLPSERRISYGCVNIPVDFFNTVVLPTFKKTDGIVYVMPDTRPMKKVFSTYYDVDARDKQAAATQEEDPIAKFASQKAN
jgi:hypothetical protein